LKIGEYIYFEEGSDGYINNKGAGALYPTTPIRSGNELELYIKIRTYVQNNDISKPENKITPEMIMKWALEANTSNGKVNFQESLLTAHNVMRALARPDAANIENLKGDDPVKAILKDNATNKTQKTRLPAILESKYKQHFSSGYGNSLFDPENPYSIFKPLTDSASTSAGSPYHFWVGALAAATIDPLTARGMVSGEGLVKRLFPGSNAGSLHHANDERPWGNAGIQAFEKSMKGVSIDRLNFPLYPTRN